MKASPDAYNLDVVLAVGHRVKSKEGILFRRWSREIERQYLLKGFVIDAARLKDPERNDHIDELLEEIEEIRASEANVWKRVLELVTKCSDYHSMTEDDRSDFFAGFQNTIHWAVSTSTAAEIIWDRSETPQSLMPVLPPLTAWKRGTNRGCSLIPGLASSSQ